MAEDKFIPYAKDTFDMKKEAKELMILWIYIFVFAIVIPSFAGLVLFGFELPEFVSSFTFYNALLTSAIVLTIIKMVEIMSKGKYANALVHDPEKAPAVFGKIKLFKKPLKLFVVCLAIFSVIGLISTIFSSPQISYFFAETPQFVTLFPQQQVTETGRLLLSAEPAALAETMFFVTIFSVISTIILNIRKKRDKVYSTLTFVICWLVGSIGWAVYHSLKYLARETSLLFTLLFGTIGSTMTLLSGSFIPWHVWHFANNFFKELASLGYGKDVILIWGGIAIFVFIGFLILFFLLRKKKE